MPGKMLGGLHTLSGHQTLCFAMLGDVWSRSNIGPTVHCFHFLVEILDRFHTRLTLLDARTLTGFFVPAKHFVYVTWLLTSPGFPRFSKHFSN